MFPVEIPTSTIWAITNGINNSKIASNAAHKTPSISCVLYFFIYGANFLIILSPLLLISFVLFKYIKHFVDEIIYLNSSSYMFLTNLIYILQYIGNYLFN